MDQNGYIEIQRHQSEFGPKFARQSERNENQFPIQIAIYIERG